MSPIATSTLTTASYPDLGLDLIANVPTPIPASAVARVQEIPGVVVTEDAPQTSDKE
jgi:hypothetical protein